MKNATAFTVTTSITNWRLKAVLCMIEAMISHLTGTVLEKKDRSLVLNVGGVGYRIFSTDASIANLETSQEVSFWTHLAVRENSLDIYGFLNERELELFELLITVSGIGPKSALGILDLNEAETLKRAVASGDPSYLTKVSGIGKKTAQRIVIELKEKLDYLEDDQVLSGETDVFEALTSLGYSEAKVRQAVRDVPIELTTSEKIKEALKRLNS